MIPIMRPSLPPLEEYVRRLEKIWDSHMLSNFGENARELEKKAQAYLGNKHVRAVSSCDTGLILGLTALNIRPGTKCIVTPFTFNSTINAIIWSGLKPDFVDIDPDTFNLSPSKVRKAITDETSAIVATHVFGNPCDMKELREIANDHDLPLVFDAAHAYGSLHKGKKIGTFGDVEVFSLSGTKLVTSAEGGLVATTHHEIAEQLGLLRNYGFLGDYNSLHVGLNGKISELNAALGCLTIDTIEAAVRRRNEIVSLYKKELSGTDGLLYQSVDRGCRSAYKDFGIRIPKKRKAVEKELASGGIQTKRYFLPPPRMPAFSRFRSRPLPETDRLYDEILCVPIYNEMSDETVVKVCEVIRSGLERRKRDAGSTARKTI